MAYIILLTSLVIITLIVCFYINILKRIKISIRQTQENHKILRSIEKNISDNYLVEKIKRKLKDENKKLSVLFLVNERSKWNSQRVFEQLQSHPRIEVQLVFKNQYLDRLSEDYSKSEHQKNYDFFKSVDSNIIDASAQNVCEVVESIDPDLIFYHHMFGFFDEAQYFQKTYLSCYVHYTLSLKNNDNYYYTTPFFNSLWTYYSESNIQANSFLKISHSSPSRAQVVGYPKLDTYLSDEAPDFKSLWKQNNESLKRIIYAPSWSIKATSLGGHSTFKENYNYFLGKAKNDKNIQWIICPHPELKTAVVDEDFMTEQKYKNYLEEWNSLDNAKVFDSGNYLSLFKTSDALITDGESFLGEYIPTKKPVLRLVRENSMWFNELGTKINSACYKALKNSDIDRFIEDVVIQNKDTLFDERVNLIRYFIDENQMASSKIVNHLKEVFEI